MYIQGKLIHPGEDLTECFEIRKEVFVKEQGIPEELEFDDLDQTALHCLIFSTDNEQNKEQNKAVATGRLILLEDGTFKIGRIAVRKEERGKHYGDMLVKILISKSFECGAKTVKLSAQVRAIKFYESIGFKTVGDVYIEDGIEHISMQLEQQDLCRTCQKEK
ncbi:GNAT family N-acetyltransferase [Lachnoclostridium phytofermentans]|uniref:GCN5-related N-acetyltransferase n=1 Tax=Lachnoclostridium phytofermentans (strain ATCC 700394 / DSM 18823 / ISDg) TaxID=357809 RepID=A9KLX6_LACP7|nr:GNAT family N-acetyltransferase [Lachnoclostridium phytofermentans]ABX44285.1 GCN5-related N-acetyltransferase [Lachnoclostridium phytofermentans ISDg]